MRWRTILPSAKLQPFWPDAVKHKNCCRLMLDQSFAAKPLAIHQLSCGTAECHEIVHYDLCITASLYEITSIALSQQVGTGETPTMRCNDRYNSLRVSLTSPRPDVGE